jgi:two-component system sensor histidine kinase/response regulator
MYKQWKVSILNSMMHTVLVVDDEPASVRAVARALADEYRVLTAPGAAAGLQLLAAEPVALMVVDQRMPGMSGAELLAHCAAHQPGIIRILLTGYTDIETLLEAINAGHVYYYLTKPWEPQELRLVVRRGLERYDVEADRRRLLGELEGALARVRREAEQKGRLLTLATHELGTPLHLLANALTFIGAAGVPPEAGAWLDTAQRSASWLGRIATQIARGARWHGRSVRLDCRPLLVSSLLADLQNAFQTMVETRHLSLQVELVDDCPPVSADRVWLGRALTNLLSNAVRFTPDGGTVTLALTKMPSAVCITVSDTGVGIDARLLDEIFEPFSAASGDVQLHTSGRFEFGARGLGLGLAIAKAIVDQHGGRIAVRSEKGAGSQFTVELPLP